MTPLSERIEIARQDWDEMTDWEELSELMMVVLQNCSEVKACRQLQDVPIVVVLDWNELTKRKDVVVTSENLSIDTMSNLASENCPAHYFLS